MADFSDINGKIVTPGAIVIVATRDGKLRQGLVQCTRIGKHNWNWERMTITLQDPGTRKYVGTYRNPKSMMVVG
jgi:hypothetical protein